MTVDAYRHSAQHQGKSTSQALPGFKGGGKFDRKRGETSSLVGGTIFYVLDRERP